MDNRSLFSPAQRLLWSFTILAASLLNSCTESSPDSPTHVFGAIVGSADVVESNYNSGGWTTYAPCVGATVWVDADGRRTITDAQGRWRLDSIPVGSHRVSIAKPGFGYAQLYYEYVLPGEERTTEEMTLRPIDSQIFMIDSIHFSGGLNAEWMIVLNAYRKGPLGTIAIAFSHDRTSLERSFDSADFYLATSISVGHISTFVAYLDPQRIKYPDAAHPLRKGDTLFVEVASAGTSTSWNQELDRQEFPFHGPESNIVPIVLP